MQTLYENQTANDTTKANAIRIGSGKFGLQASGTWDTATLSVYISNIGIADPSPVLRDDFTFTENGYLDVDLKRGSWIWGELTSVGAGTDISLTLTGK